MSEYVPTTKEVRSDYQWGVHACGCCAERRPEDVEAFDRWLAAHDAEVAATALEEMAASAIPRKALANDTRKWLRERAAEYRKAVQDD